MASGSEPTQPGHFLAVGLREAFAGTIISMLSIAYGLSYAALIFSGPLTPALGYGIAATFITGAISAAVVALRSSLPFAIAGPDSSVSAVNATLVAALIEQLATRGRPEQLVMPALIIMALAAALTGLLLCGLGITRAGRAIRFVPYPVIGGFLGATGWVMVNGAVRVITDERGHIRRPSRPLTSHFTCLKLAAGLAVACSHLHLPCSVRTTASVLPVILPAPSRPGISAFVAGTTIAQAQSKAGCSASQSAVGLVVAMAVRPLVIFHGARCPPFPAIYWCHVRHRHQSCCSTSPESSYAIAARGRPRTRTQLAWDRQPDFGGVRRLCELRFDSRTTINYAAGARGRLSGSPLRDFGGRSPVRQSRLSWVRAEICAGRLAALFRPRLDCFAG